LCKSHLHGVFIAIATAAGTKDLRRIDSAWSRDHNFHQRDRQQVSGVYRFDRAHIARGEQNVLAGAVEWVRVPSGDSLAQPHHASAEISAFTLPEFLVLVVLKEHEMYGLEIARSLSEHPDFGVPPGNGVLYPVLKTLVRDGALNARRVPGTPRIYYSLTDQGRERLLAIAKRWADLNDAVQSLVAGPQTARQPEQPRV